jgi:hypothetical protein
MLYQPFGFSHLKPLPRPTLSLGLFHLGDFGLRLRVLQKQTYKGKE